MSVGNFWSKSCWGWSLASGAQAWGGRETSKCIHFWLFFLISMLHPSSQPSYLWKSLAKPVYKCPFCLLSAKAQPRPSPVYWHRAPTADSHTLTHLSLQPQRQASLLPTCKRGNRLRNKWLKVPHCSLENTRAGTLVLNTLKKALKLAASFITVSARTLPFFHFTPLGKLLKHFPPYSPHPSPPSKTLIPQTYCVSVYALWFFGRPQTTVNTHIFFGQDAQRTGSQEPVPGAVEAQSLNDWNTGEVPNICFLSPSLRSRKSFHPHADNILSVVNTEHTPLQYLQSSCLCQQKAGIFLWC